MDALQITRPDDWHVHFRDGAHLHHVVPDTARRFGRAIVMPNLDPPVTTVAAALAYRRKILEAAPAGVEFEPLMTLYLTDETTAAEIHRIRESAQVHAVKLYPAGATTNAASGVTDISRPERALSAMEASGIPLLVHGEVADPAVDVFDRERVFIDRVLAPLVRRFPALKIVLEHVTTADAVAFVNESPANVAATITAHHLVLNRNALFIDGLRPHHYCLPVPKRESHRQALIEAATGGSRKFFLGTDSAPHGRRRKEAACGCAGVYTAHAGIELYAEVFEAAGALARLEAFASFNGPDFYGLPRNREKITLRKAVQDVPPTLPFDDDVLIPFRAGGQLSWSLG
jgi:dihydroorotase